jgi:hypothetical protein
MKKIQTLVGVIALAAFSVLPMSAQEYGVNYTRGTKHITTKTTTNVTTSSCVLYTLVINVSGAGTSWTISVQDKATTPQIVYAATVATGTTVIALPIGIKMDSGIDIVTAGTTAGTMDVKYAFR